MKFRAFCYPVNWVFKDPDSGAEFKAESQAALIKHIVTYRAQNGYPQIESLDIVLENYLCQQPQNQGGCLQYTLSRDLYSYIKGGVALIKNTILQKFVEKKEADRRGAICLKCPNNSFPDRNHFLKWSDDVAIRSVGNRKSEHHHDLGNCAVCTCPLRAKVWLVPPFSLKPEHATQMRKDKPNCWQLPENEFKDRIDTDDNKGNPK